MTLKEMRQAAKLTQAAAAEALAIGQCSISAWEIGTARPTIDKLKPMAGLYGVTLEALVDAITGEGRESHGNRIPADGPGRQGRGRPHAN